MKAVVQRVRNATVSIDGNIHSSIGQGFLVLLGIHKEDTDSDIEWMVRKVANMRVFEDENGLMNSDLSTIEGEVLVVSQFTLIASTKKGNRPSFNDAADPQKGNAYYLRVAKGLESVLDRPVKTGVFAANMQVSLVNDGPVTITLDTRNRE
jgi:D-tyrosyl-tRNA(Tyr) deacylase|tara:strand:- start:654 stop:1106 length:453 start_codon:yes stop_codon:yes gene_type:complete